MIPFLIFLIDIVGRITRPKNGKGDYKYFKYLNI